MNGGEFIDEFSFYIGNICAMLLLHYTLYIHFCVLAEINRYMFVKYSILTICLDFLQI